MAELGSITLEGKQVRLEPLRPDHAEGLLSAQYEGTLRNHRIRRDGTIRDMVMFSIIDREWPDVKAGLLRRLGW